MQQVPASSSTAVGARGCKRRVGAGLRKLSEHIAQRSHVCEINPPRRERRAGAAERGVSGNRTLNLVCTEAWRDPSEPKAIQASGLAASCCYPADGLSRGPFTAELPEGAANPCPTEGLGDHRVRMSKAGSPQAGAPVRLSQRRMANRRGPILGGQVVGQPGLAPDPPSDRGHSMLPRDRGHLRVAEEPGQLGVPRPSDPPDHRPLVRDTWMSGVQRSQNRPMSGRAHDAASLFAWGAASNCVQ